MSPVARLALPLAAALLLLAAPALAVTKPSSPPPPAKSRAAAPPAATEARRCSVLFGTAAKRRENAERRALRLHWLDDHDARSVTIVHGTDGWNTPRSLRFEGLVLERTHGSGDNRVAVMRVGARLARSARCAAGRYTVGMDDSLGRLRVLAVLRDGLLVDAAGHLGYLARPSTSAPAFVLAWGSSYRVIVAAAGGSSSTSRYRFSRYRRLRRHYYNRFRYNPRRYRR